MIGVSSHYPAPHYLDVPLEHPDAALASESPPILRARGDHWEGQVSDTTQRVTAAPQMLGRRASSPSISVSDLATKYENTRRPLLSLLASRPLLANTGSKGYDPSS